MLIKILKNTVCNGKDVAPDDVVEADKHAAKFLIGRKFAEEASKAELAKLAKAKAKKADDEAKAAEKVAADKAEADKKADDEAKAKESEKKSK